MYAPYVRISSGNLFTTLDTTARNTLGSIYAPPANPNGPTTGKGYGAQPVVKYVYYNSTTNPAPTTAPAPVYYTDESFTTVTGNAAEALSAGAGTPYIAGYLLVNTTSVSGLTAAQLNQSYVFIQIGGLLVGAIAPTSGGGANVLIVGAASGNWAATGTGTATTNRFFGTQLAAASGGVADVLLGGQSTFWGS